MNCPVCNRNNAVTLSICPSCGAMIGDSVREELELVTKPVVRTVSPEKKPSPAVPNKPIQPSVATIKETPPPPKPVVVKNDTTEITVKHTAPTLVEFHNKNAIVPEWRLQLQNAVRQRQSRSKTEVESAVLSSVSQAKLVTSGANALKVEPVAEPEIVFHENPKINSALQRIEKSRQQFFEEEKEEFTPEPLETSAPVQSKNYPFYIASKSNEAGVSTTQKTEIKAPANFAAVNKPVTALKAEKKDFDTNKLPPLSSVLSKTEKNQAVSETTDTNIHITQKPEVKLAAVEEIIIDDDAEIEEIEDLAPFAMRFNAGLFDLIIGSFLSVLLLTPFMIMNENWLTMPALLTFLVTCSVVMFLYMTMSIGLYGKTFGMRLFSLELVDIEGEDYPTIHQAAVSSAVYLLSLALGGIGFITLPFNEEKRALHDLASKTIVVKEL